MSDSETAGQGEPRSRERRGKGPGRVVVGVLVVAALGLTCLVWWAAPRSTSVRVSSPVVCSYPRDGSFDRTAIVDCGGGGVQGVVHLGETLVPAPRSRQEELPRKVPGATVNGQLRIEKGWLGFYRYFFVGEEGTVTELFVTPHYIGGVEETLW